MSAMLHLVRELEALGRSAGRRWQRVTQDQYQIWRKKYTWDGVKGISYGRSFCEHFGIRDNILSYYRSVSVADRYIRNHYLDDPR